MSPEDLKFRNQSVFVICWAGSDRSRYISEELNARGYFATHGGVLEGQNYVTKQDLANVGRIIFSSTFEKEEFDKNRILKEFVKRNGIQTYVMNITESDKDRTHNTGKIDELKLEISAQLDSLGFRRLSTDGK